MATMRELKRRITSVHSSQKITGAMRMISSARFHKAELALRHAMPYEEQLQLILNHINEKDCDYFSPLREERGISNVTLVALASDEGLCGAFNINVAKKLAEAVGEYRETVGHPIRVYPVGKKIVGSVKRMKGVEMADISPLFSLKKYPEAVDALTEELISLFLSGQTDRVELIYTHFKSMGTQTVMRLQLLPLRPLKHRVPSEEAGPDRLEAERMYLYEPDCRSIFDMLYPLIIRTMFYKALLESHTSEQAMRILSMQIANDNAVKLLGKLQLEYNKLRQQSITTELLDMAGGTIQNA